ncbi:MAG: DEAD/DEAH box helicase [Verrucomicrobiales bacterium]
MFDPTRPQTVEIATTEFLRLAGPLTAAADLDTSQLNLELIAVHPEIQIHLDGSVAELRASLFASYPDGPPVMLPSHVENDFPRLSREKPGRFWLRDEAVEADALSRIKGFGFQSSAGSENTFVLRGENLVLTWIASMGRLLPDDWQIVSSDRWQRTMATVEVAKFRFDGASTSEGWLEGELKCATDSGLTISRADLHRLLRSQRGHFQSSAGRRVVVDLGLAGEIEEVLRDVGANQSTPGQFRFRREQLAYLQETLQPSASGGAGHVAMLDGEAAGPIWKMLRPYQQKGVSWLVAQSGHDLGAVLADDMGLGKTLQTLVFLEWQRRQGQDGPALVVCPTSLLGSWRDEAARFFPAWRVLVQHGQKRNQDWEVLDAADLVLTSYALVSRDADRYQEHEFRAIVLDEASLIRNPDSQMAKATHRLRGKARIALTGTPVENSVRDLWSVARFVQPGYLGTRDDFKMRYEKSVSAGDKAAGVRLQRRLKPLLLRRLKSDVARDLPARLENTAWCELEGEQAALYQAVLRESRDKAADAIKKDGFARARMSVLTALLRLRQICCDPGLVGIDTGPGAKRELFRERLREALEGGHRVLVFSQFTTMLERLREDVREFGVEPCWLTGASQDRADQVRAFQEGTSPVFLLSLKAGGYGLTLTAADTVFLYDPWWNPAVEAQAIDRAHRIGQAKVVSAYRFAARGTVEEKILRLQEKKRTIAEQTLGADDDLEATGDTDLRELLGV